MTVDDIVTSAAKESARTGNRSFSNVTTYAELSAINTVEE